MLWDGGWINLCNVLKINELHADFLLTYPKQLKSEGKYVEIRSLETFMHDVKISDSINQ